VGRTGTMAAVALLVGCGGSGGKGEDTAAVDPAAAATDAYPGLAGCADDLTKAQADRHLAILDESEDSMHEMVVCGGLYFQLLGDLVGYLATVAVNGPDSAQLTEGYRFDGAGAYVAAPPDAGSTSMHVRFHFGDDYTAGARGALVTDNLFDADSYLENVRVDLDTGTGEVLLRHDGPGPLVELLGLGTNPGRPVRLGTAEIDGIATEIGKLLVDLDIRVEDPRVLATVTYDVEVAQDTVAAVLAGDRAVLDMTSMTADSDDPQQHLVSRDWDVEYNDSQGGLDGTIGFVVSGGSFDYEGVWTYEASGWPTRRTVACAAR
jgi:hypothetical protein